MARSANYRGYEPGARSLQWNVIRRAAGLLSPASLLTDNQLYVAASLCGSSQNVRFSVNNFQIVSVVYKDVLS